MSPTLVVSDSPQSIMWSGELLPLTHLKGHHLKWMKYLSWDSSRCSLARVLFFLWLSYWVSWMSSFLYISLLNVVLNHLLKLRHLIEATREKANISWQESFKTKQLIEKKHKRNPVLLWNFRNHCYVTVVQYIHKETASQHCQTLLLFFLTW